MRAPAPKGRGFFSVLAGASSIRSDGRFLDAAKPTLPAIAVDPLLPKTELQDGRSVPAAKPSTTDGRAPGNLLVLGLYRAGNFGNEWQYGAFELC
jgi:hypothetical protein